MENYYSQNGEDFLLSQLFNQNLNDGFFVEVGCIDGKRFSNTLYFEEKGWKGICVEAHQGFIEDLIKNRPNSIVVPSAVSDKDDENVVFYANKRGSLSTLDPSQEERFKTHYKEYFTGFEEQTVSQRSLTSIFDEHNVAKIDILSIDIEGHEIEALLGLDLKKYAPKVLIIETDSDEHTRKVESLLEGYHLILNFKGNLIFTKNISDKEKIANKVFENIHVIQTKHPADNFEEKTNIITIDTRVVKNGSSPTLLNRIKHKVKSMIKGTDQNKAVEREYSSIGTVGFHGDQYLLKIANFCLGRSQSFVETGTNVGTTVAYVANKYENIDCYSCEIDAGAFDQANKNLANHKNIRLYKQGSLEFIETLKKHHSNIFNTTTCFWLDAHGYGFKWLLKEEISFATTFFKDAFIFIDDFKVPGLEMFGFDDYGDQVCSFEFIEDYLDKSKNYKLIYPTYTEKTSTHHPLRGWGLIVVGNEDLIVDFGDEINSFIKVIDIKND